MHKFFNTFVTHIYMYMIRAISCYPQEFKLY